MGTTLRSGAFLFFFFCCTLYVVLDAAGVIPHIAWLPAVATVLLFAAIIWERRLSKRHPKRSDSH
jgi:hypothetical protein